MAAILAVETKKARPYWVMVICKNREQEELAEMASLQNKETVAILDFISMQKLFM